MRSDVALDSHARFLAVKWTAMLSASHLIEENGHGGEGRTVRARGPGYSDAGREGRLFARGHRDRAGQANLHRRPARPRRRREDRRPRRHARAIGADLQEPGCLLKAAGATWADVVKTNTFVTDYE